MTRRPLYMLIALMAVFAAACNGTTQTSILPNPVAGASHWVLAQVHDRDAATGDAYMELIAIHVETNGVFDMCFDWAETVDDTESPTRDVDLDGDGELDTNILAVGTSCRDDVFLENGATETLTRPATQGGYMHVIDSRWRQAVPVTGPWCEAHDADGSNPTWCHAVPAP